jgi:hypothetical protein
MKLTWTIEPDDVKTVKRFLADHIDRKFVQDRIRTNLRTDKLPVTKDNFWYWTVVCLLTTQQKSGPDGAVWRFNEVEPYPLRYGVCLEHANDLAAHVERVLSEFGGLRRFRVIGGELSSNLNYLENGGWDEMLGHLERVRAEQSKESERQAAEVIDDKLKGFGPKQSRNLLQCLGLSKYEVPIDSRLTKWLNRFGFPVHLSATILGDRHYYNFVSEGFQRLCQECGVEPCVLDAAIFASFD